MRVGILAFGETEGERGRGLLGFGPNLADKCSAVGQSRIS